MIKSILLPRAAVRAAILVLGALVLTPAGALAFTPVPVGHKPSGESAPLNLTPSQVGAHTSSSGPSIVRTIVGLLVVIAVIWGLSWILRQVKSGRETRSAGEGLRSIATLPLGFGPLAAPGARGRGLPAGGQRGARRGADSPLHRAAGARSRD